MKPKSALLALALLITGALAAQIPSLVTTVTFDVDTLRDQAANNRNLYRAMVPVSDYAAGYFAGRAAVLDQLADSANYNHQSQPQP